MAKKHMEHLLDAVEFKHLRYFAVTAEECSLRRAAERLFIAQPPLSRQIKHLEERLGVSLFVRHNKGLVLTEEGAKTLEIIKPLLAMRDTVFQRLRHEVPSGRAGLRLGFTTAFEQGVFAGLESMLHERYGDSLHISRAPSPKLASEVRKGGLDAALVALPLDAPGLTVRDLNRSEPLVAAIPSAWPEAKEAESLRLQAFTGKPLFWFRREANPAYFDFAKRRFAVAGFAPQFMEEPVEHDVLLARIASGEGMGLFAASFAAIRRKGVVFTTIKEPEDFRLCLGTVTLPNREDIGLILANFLLPS